MTTPPGRSLGVVDGREILAGDCSHLAMYASLGQSEANAPILLYEGPIKVTDERGSSDEHALVEYIFVPATRLRLLIKTPTRLISMGGKGDISLEIPGADNAVKAIVTSSGATFGTVAAIAPVAAILTDDVTFHLTERIGRIRFHLLNFREYFGERVYRNQGDEFWTGRTTFKMGPWQVTVDAVRNQAHVLKNAREANGFAITHIVNLESNVLSGTIPKLFGAKDVCRALEVLYFVFTFANGSRTSCLLPHGYRHMPAHVSRAWQSHKVSRAKHTDSWFPKHAPSRGFGFASRLYELFADEDEKSWLTYAISLYVESNRNASGVDIELAKSQIALELLSWEACQERQQLMSRDGFERSSAADRIRLALLWAGIPTTIPDALPELKLALPILQEGEVGPFDGPFAITQLRNATIHATRSKRRRLNKLGDFARYEAWKLSQSYVELLILRLLSYDGPYQPRFSTPGTPRLFEIVPWKLN